MISESRCMLGRSAFWSCSSAGASLRLQLDADQLQVPNEPEVAAMLAFRPDRLGHCCCLSPAARQQLCDAQIPVELCLSSNVITESVPGFPAHHFGPLHSEGAPDVTPACCMLWACSGGKQQIAAAVHNHTVMTGPELYTDVECRCRACRPVHR